MIAHLYKISNTETGVFYVGKHVGETQNGYWGSGKVWKAHVKKHGKDNLKYDILVIGEEDYILDLERLYVTHSYIKENALCYNLIQGGYGSGRLPQETVNRIADKLRGKPTWNKGVPMTEEAKQKLRIAKRVFHLGIKVFQ